MDNNGGLYTKFYIRKKQLFLCCLAFMTIIYSDTAKAAVSLSKLHKSNENYYSSGLTEANLFKIEGGYERVEWEKGEIYVEAYSESFTPESTKTVSATNILPNGCSKSDLKIGGVYEGADNNFVVTGRTNLNESSSLITIRVTKFTKDWEYISNCEINEDQGVEIYNPFAFAALRMEELNGQLWISTGRTGFGEIHHQGKQNLIINEANMTLVGSAADFWHSFDQYLAVCNGVMYQMELSEGSRSVFVEQLDQKSYTGGWSANWVSGSVKHNNIFSFWSSDEYGMWSYDLYGQTGGFAASDKNSTLLSVGNSVDQSKVTENSAGKLNYNVWICSTSTDMETNKSNQLSSYKDGSKYNAGTPHIAKVDDDRFLVIWPEEQNGEPGGTLKYVFVNAFGEKITDVFAMDGYLSDVVPVNDGNGNLVWYTTDEGYPVFYTIYADGTNAVKYLAPESKGRLIYDKKSKSYYEVTNGNKSKLKVSYAYPKDYKVKSVTIPKTITYNGYTYKVTSILQGALSGYTKLTKVVIGEEVTTIPQYTFYGSTKLKTVKIKSKKIKSIGRLAFYNINKKAVVYVPKSKKASYKKKLKTGLYYGKIKTF